MDKQQIKWASQHDWFVKANDSLDGIGYTVTVIESIADVSKPGELVWVDKELVFVELDELRAWAGY